MVGTIKCNAAVIAGKLGTTIALNAVSYLYFLGALRPAADIAVWHRDEVREAITAGLIHKVPCKDGWIIFVQPVVDGVAPVDHGVDVILEKLLGAWVCEEDIVTLSSRPLNVLQAKRHKKFITRGDTVHNQG